MRATNTQLRISGGWNRTQGSTQSSLCARTQSFSNRHPPPPPIPLTLKPKPGADNLSVVAGNFAVGQLSGKARAGLPVGAGVGVGDRSRPHRWPRPSAGSQRAAPVPAPPTRRARL